MKKTLLLGMMFMCILWWGCEKVDTTYRDYNNELISFKGNSYEYLQSKVGIYDSLLYAISRINGLEDTLRNKSVTLFAVSNNSFTRAMENLNSARLDSGFLTTVSLKEIDTKILDTFLCRYIVRGAFTSDSLLRSGDGFDVPTIKYDYVMNMQYKQTDASGFVGGGPRAIIFSDRRNSIFSRYWIRVNTVTTDIRTNNGLINILPAGHDFGFGSGFISAVNRR